MATPPTICDWILKDYHKMLASMEIKVGGHLLLDREVRGITYERLDMSWI